MFFMYLYLQSDDSFDEGWYPAPKHYQKKPPAAEETQKKTRWSDCRGRTKVLQVKREKWEKVSYCFNLTLSILGYLLPQTVI